MPQVKCAQVGRPDEDLVSISTNKANDQKGQGPT